jgi:hypothetical protein
MPQHPVGIRVGLRLVVIRDGRFVGKPRKKAGTPSDRKARGSAGAR